MEIYKEPGESGRVYHVFDAGTKKDDAIAEAARYQKVGRARMKTITVYLDGDDLYLKASKGRTKALAVVRSQRHEPEKG